MAALCGVHGYHLAGRSGVAHQSHQEMGEAKISMISFLIQHWERIMPILMMMLSTGSSIVYFVHGDVRKGFYWLAATILTASVTF